MSDKKEIRCHLCNGTGQCQKTRQVLDLAMGLALGTATGIGIMPTYKTEYYQETCYSCGGKGKKDG